MPKTKSNYTELISSFLHENAGSTSQDILAAMNNSFSIATLKRILKTMVADGLITVSGKLKTTKYSVSHAYEIMQPINVDAYYAKEIDERKIKDQFNHELISNTLQKLSLFTKDEATFLTTLQKKFAENVSRLSPLEFKNEMDRLAIDLSWKSSQIEGNTYSLLETERLLRDKQTAGGKTKDEATMLLNHKDAIDFIVEHSGYVNPLTIKSIEDIHSLLIKELGISRNVRNRRVGISGTNYKPLDNEFQIKEALQDLCNIVNLKQSIFEKALLALVLISYIQPFADGNKRTARIVSNAILINNNCCPISFRTIDSVEYKKAMLIFYEQNNINPFKKIFINQFEFAVNTYF